MERLDLSTTGRQAYREASIHLARYMPVRDLVQGRSVLDIACGEGYAVRMFVQAGARRAVGVDNSEHAISVATQVCDELAASFVLSDALAYLQSTEERFDLIACVETLEHVDQPEKVLNGLFGRLNPGGILYVTYPNDALYYGSPVSLNPFHKTVLTFSDFERLLRALPTANVEFGYGAVVDGFLNISVSSEGATAAQSASVQPSAGDLVESGVDCNVSCLGLDNTAKPDESLYYYAVISPAPLPIRPTLSGAIYSIAGDQSPSSLGLPRSRRRKQLHEITLLCGEADAKRREMADRLVGLYKGTLDVSVAICKPSSLSEVLLEGRKRHVHFMSPQLAGFLVKIAYGTIPLADAEALANKLEHVFLSVSNKQAISDATLRTAVENFFNVTWDTAVSDRLDDRNSLTVLVLSCLRSRTSWKWRGDGLRLRSQ